MTTAHGTPTHLRTGPSGAGSVITKAEVQEYERILKINDQIFSGLHARLKVPAQSVRKPGTRIGQSLQKGSTLSPAPAIVTHSTSSTNIPPNPTLGLDPIFLTKSDDLVRAEIQIKRQRVEKALDQKMKEYEAQYIQIDVDEVLSKAMQVVKPLSPSPTSDPYSVDDNSLYSSRAPDSTPPNQYKKPPPAAPTHPVASISRSDGQYSVELQRLESLNRTGSDQEMQDAYRVADPRIPSSQKQLRPDQVEAANVESDEPDYSPYSPHSPPHQDYSPPPVAPLFDNRLFGQKAAALEIGGSDRNSHVQGPAPRNNVQVVRNHITSPAAPQPSRVSPLAYSKFPTGTQLQGQRFQRAENGGPYIDSTSPNGAVPQITSQKRKWVQVVEDGTRHVSNIAQNTDSSDTYIKVERVSPPPFPDDRVRQRERRPMYIDIASPQYETVIERHEPPVRAPIFKADQHREIPYQNRPPRTMSRLSVQHPVLEDSHLVDVSRMQYAASEYPRGYIESDPRHARAASYAVVERRLPEQPRYYEEASSQYGPRYVTVDDMLPPTRGQSYHEELPPRAVSGPQRRIVVDEHGTQYEMVPVQSQQHTMLPPPRPISRAPAPTRDFYDDRVSTRTASVRAPSVVQEPYIERRYAQEMAPPHPVYRHVTADYPRPVAFGRRVFSAPYDASAEYLTQHRPTFTGEHAIPQERVIRTASVRPQSAQYDEPHEFVQRVGSVRPLGPNHEGNVYMEERQGEYIEQPYMVRERPF
ncbi:hypothetical protein N7495_004012 [Penicillium taxi]|uniref:uncharacterized protein n=1 Tax=Penicillium taxi TaxID=168475 RepID=UPI0025456DDD|nr:uncharacterized protein N7495_004012 [Penicillium taxi]KAJ5899268.1 hypothetical protein N7495_004012 [Penicillium taxi]